MVSPTRRRWMCALGGMMLLVAGCPPATPVERLERSSGQEARRQRSSQDERVVVSVNGEEITRRELERRLQRLPEYIRVQYRTTQKKKTYLKSIKQFEIMADVAESQGLGTHPSVRDEMLSALARDYLKRTLRQRELSMQSIDEEAIREAFRTRYKEPERRRTAIIVARSKERLEYVRDKLTDRSYPSVVKKIEAFRRAASRYSNHASSAKGGDVGNVLPPDHEEDDPELAETVYGLDELGDLSPIVERNDHWEIVTYYRRKPPTRLEAVTRRIRTELYEERKKKLRDNLVDTWYEEAEISKREEVLEDLTRPEPPREVHLDEIPLQSPSIENALP